MTRVYTIRLACGHTGDTQTLDEICEHAGDRYHFCRTCDRLERVESIHVYHGWNK